MPKSNLTVISERCSVTAFDMKVTLSRDGRDRGLWIWLLDDSEARAKVYEEWSAAALEMFCKRAGIEDNSMKKFSAAMAMDEFRHIANSKVQEAVLLEWPAIKRFHKAMGKAIKIGEAAEKKCLKEWEASCRKREKANAAKAKKRRKKK